ncbi:hypothetical protein [Paraburkholderia youngii]|uniref:Uncharacterized protein n=1 Tax=Paraburkholderia youngii TaxID=2782701 RepID=A0A7W8L8U0_9BURK|nr:hypothetical protein [Paraburkholderia youngii]MBB5402635.1 hypothetical protein [Paraburkholderia youngii]
MTYKTFTLGDLWALLTPLSITHRQAVLTTRAEAQSFVRDLMMAQGV